MLTSFLPCICHSRRFYNSLTTNEVHIPAWPVRNTLWPFTADSIIQFALGLNFWKRRFTNTNNEILKRTEILFYEYKLDTFFKEPLLLKCHFLNLDYDRKLYRKPYLPLLHWIYATATLFSSSEGQNVIGLTNENTFPRGLSINLHSHCPTTG